MNVDEQNRQTSKREQREILANPPSSAVAYLRRLPHQPNRYEVTTWMGDPLGTATLTHEWPVHGSIWGTHMGQYRATIRDREYTGRSWGDGMSIVLRETVASRRAREEA